MKTQGSGGTAPPFLTLALDKVECPASHPFCFTPGETAPIIHQIRGYASLAGLDTGETKNHLLLSEIEPPLLQPFSL
jgi:hypothetical protein